MKKSYFLLAAALLVSMSMQAQTKVVSLGFEQGDTKYTTEGAYTPGGLFGDWVNQAEGDEWNEAFADDTHSGNAAMQMLNDVNLNGNTWDRGFKVGNLQLKENTAYRVSFWVKADQDYTNAEGSSATRCIKSSLAIGKEYFDMPISTASGQQYYYNYTNGFFNGEWKRFSYVTFFTNKADQDALSGPYSGKTDANGDVVSAEGDPFPNEYFLIINMYNPGEYLLDDIAIEEGVTFNEATFNGDVIKLDFGYPTNIADLAKANNGFLSLDPSCVSVSIDGESAPVEYVEGLSDGYLYIFLNETYADDGQDVVVSFTPADDCPILYNTDKRPSADVTTDMKVLGFQAEVAYFDPDVYAMSSAMSPAEMVSSVPENESFEIDAATFKNIAITYDKVISLDYASATLSKNGVDEDLTDNMSLSEDGKTINVAVSDLADGEYTLTLSGVTNKYGVDCQGDQVITFALGQDTDTSTSEVVYASDFDNDMTGGIPPGWVTYNEAGFHIYGFNDEERTSQYNYNWGGNPGGGGARLYDGFSGDFIKAMYWGSRGTNDGYAEYGSQVKDWILPGGSLDPNMPEGIALILEPRKYQVSFVMAAWKGEPVFRFTLEDLEGNVYAQFNDFVAKPNMNGTQGPVSGSLKCTTDFTVDKAGYYVLRFAAQDAQWQEFLLANVKVITMPSKAAYWKQQLALAVENVEPILEAADDEMYNGETKTAFAAAIERAKTEHFTSPSEITALIDELKDLGAKMETRVTNIDAFSQALDDAMEAYSTLDEKYLNADIAVNAQAILDTYANTNPSELNDADLAEVTPKLVTAAAQLKNITDVVNILTWGAYKAFQTAETLGADGSAALELTTDDRAVINEVNLASKIALYNAIVDNDGDIEAYKTTANYDGSYIVVDGEYVTTDPAEAAAEGIDFTGLIQNPHFYTFGTNSGANLEDNTIVGWNCEQFKNYDGEGTLISQGGLHFSGDAATAAKPVSDVMINAYGAGGEYNFYQVIENAPVGVYDVWFGSRTASSTYGEGIFEPFNACNDETGIWDKYIYAQVDDEPAMMTPFAVGGWGTHPTVVKNVVVKEGSKLTIGIVEHYTSGKATKGGEPRDFWDTNTFADDARLFFAAPLEGYDYRAALEAIATGVEELNARTSRVAAGIYSTSGVRLNAMQKGVNIVKRADGSINKVLVK